MRAVSSSATLMAVICDVESSESVRSLAGRIKIEVGLLDTVVVNVTHYGPMVTSVVADEPLDFRLVVMTNILGADHGTLSPPTPPGHWIEVQRHYWNFLPRCLDDCSRSPSHSCLYEQTWLIKIDSMVAGEF